MRTLTLVFHAIALLGSAPRTAPAQQPPAVLKLTDGRTIYITGLKRWTVAMIQDSLNRYSPGDSLQSHACAAVLRYKLHFADAAASTLRMEPRARDVIFVDVREPQDSARVRYRAMPLDTTAPRPEWRSATSVIGASPRAFRAGAAAFLAGRIVAPADTAAVAIAAFFQNRSRREDYRTALTVLATSRNFRDRAVAAILVTHFPDEQDTWAALLDAIRESDGLVKEMANQAISTVAERSRMTPDWKALAPAVYAILDGTSLFVLDDLIDILAPRSDIGPTLASAFLAQGGEMLVNFAESPEKSRSAPARQLLTKLHGTDLGADGAAWRAWINTLKR